MPLYEFRCSSCGEKFEELCAADAKPSCPKCGAPNTARLFSPFATKSGASFQGSVKSSGGCAGCGGGSCSTCH